MMVKFVQPFEKIYCISCPPLPHGLKIGALGPPVHLVCVAAPGSRAVQADGVVRVDLWRRRLTPIDMLLIRLDLYELMVSGHLGLGVMLLAHVLEPSGKRASGTRWGGPL